MPRQVSNPPNPWSSTHVEWLGEPPHVELKTYTERVKTVLTENHSPDLHFRWTLNPYRGCFHACSYCYARPSHQYWDFGAGTDFERKIIVKVNAPEVLREQLARPKWERELVALGGNTDCYQPLEASYELTRRCLEVFADFANPVGIVTKGLLIRRDIDVLKRLARYGCVGVHMSIAFANNDTSRKVEPFAPAPSQRFETLRALSEAGIPTGVAIAPVIPGLNDTDVPEILERAYEAGARSAFMMMLRLPREVLPVFTERLEEAFPPERVQRVFNAIREARNGRLNIAEFGQRMHGCGPRWQIVQGLFDSHVRRLGMNQEPLVQPTPDRPARPGSQGSLFD